MELRVFLITHRPTGPQIFGLKAKKRRKSFAFLFVYSA
ncbi:hypothetical protein D046_8873, partial [Vibrio parahaemolyticus V-223/04]